jgi:hypothetical protein
VCPSYLKVCCQTNRVQPPHLPSGCLWELLHSIFVRLGHRLGVFENRVLMRIFGPKREEVEGGWRRLRNEKLHNLYASLNIIRMIKLRMLGLVGHVVRMER